MTSDQGPSLVPGPAARSRAKQRLSAVLVVLAVFVAAGTLEVSVLRIGLPGTPTQIAIPVASSRADGLVTNEFAHWNPTNPSRVVSPDWDMTSGSLFAHDGNGWTGVPDDVPPNATSSNGNDSVVFRLNTTRDDFGDVAVSFDLQNDGLVETPRTPAQAYDGVHVWLRYQSQYELYALSVNRRDGEAAIKKKVPGGPDPSNGGTYYDLVPERRIPVPYGSWQRVRATARTIRPDAVEIELYVDGNLVLSAVDDGKMGGPPITQNGAVGIRGDNCEFEFKNFTIAPI